MKNVFQATRPSWAYRWDVLATAIVGICCSIASLRFVSKVIETHFSGDYKEALIEGIYVGALTIIFIVLRWFWKWRCCTRFYPSTYFYCFERKPYAAAISEKLVVGYFYIEALENGDLSVQGASFDWEDGTIDNTSKAAFDSEHVGSAQIEKENICVIFYRVRKGFESKRPYHRGFFHFRLSKPHDNQNGIDSYYGYMQAMEEPMNIYVHSQVYSEFHCKGKKSENEIKGILIDSAGVLFAKRKRMLQSENA